MTPARSLSIRRAAMAAAITAAGLCNWALAASAEDRLPLKALAVPVPRPWSEVMAEKYFPETAQKAPAARIFRLTRDQIDATVKTLLPGYYGSSVKSVMSRDPLQTNYEYADLLTVNSANFGGLTGWIGEIAQRVRKAPAGVVDCGAKAGDTCLTEKARGFVVRAFRGDVGSDKIKQISDFYLGRVKEAGFETATGDLVEVVLNSPNFLFRKDIDSGSDRGLVQARRLQALTYTLTDSPPEAFNLRSDQAPTYFRSGQTAAATLDAVITAPAAREKLKRFFTAWLEIKDATDFTISPNYYPEFNPELAAAMLRESDRFLDAQLGKSAPKLKDITQGELPAAAQDMAAIYKPVKVDPIALKLAESDGPLRMGIFSLPAVLASHSGPTTTRSMKRGVFWGKKVMCMNMQPPPPNLHIELDEIDNATERQRIEQTTKRSACAGCHSVINPLGFFQENYDATGKWRTEENGQPVDSSVVINFLGEGPIRKTQTPVQAIKVLTNSTMFKQCFVRQLFRFYMGRNEDAGDDPVLRQMYEKFTSTDQDILKTVSVLSASDRIVKPQ